MSGTHRLSCRAATWAAPVLALGLVLGLSACGGDTAAAPESSTASQEPSGDASPTAEPTTSAKASPTPESTDEPAPTSEPEPTDEPAPSEPDEPADCDLLADALGAYFPAISGFSSAVASGDPGGVFSAARQLDNVLNGFANGAPGMSDNARVFLELNEEAVRMALEASESGDVTGLDVRIQELLGNDEERYLAGQQELDDYVNAQCS